MGGQDGIEVTNSKNASLNGFYDRYEFDCELPQELLQILVRTQNTTEDHVRSRWRDYMDTVGGRPWYWKADRDAGEHATIWWGQSYNEEWEFMVMAKRTISR